MLGMMFGSEGFPCNNHFSHLVLAMVLMVLACQAFAVTVCCIVPNLRLGTDCGVAHRYSVIFR